MRHPARMRISAGKSTGTCANWRRLSLTAPAASFFSRDLEPVTPRPPSSARLRGVRPVLHPLAGRTLPLRSECLEGPWVFAPRQRSRHSASLNHRGCDPFLVDRELTRYSPSATSLPTSRFTIELNGSKAQPGSSEPNSFSTRSGSPASIAPSASRSSNAAPCQKGFADFLREQHPVNTVKKVAELTGASESTVDKWLARVSLPHLRHLGPLLSVYGPSVVAALFPAAPRWLDDAVRAEELRRLDDAAAAAAAARDAYQREMQGRAK